MKIKHIATVAAMLLLAACGGEDTNLATDQRASFVSYFNTLGITGYTLSEGVFRYVANADRESYGTDTEAWKGDSLYFMFEERFFDASSNPLYFTNKKYLADENPILNPTYWSFDPIGAKVGKTKLLTGISRSLAGCRQGDSVVLLLSADLAYGSKSIGVVPPNSPIMVVLNIKEVVKQ